ncbi:hypothetical protein CBOM_01801 [Ceraceosorus bombacis]|uniref:Uncharacterized protein n=1 Tax=Ceraceosorus bombacis TaxID=401625 RepID=A0A0P1BCT2_9BASI|nr:hypothetical protein CBOM_01801 [Ceraceosorus bombacis]
MASRVLLPHFLRARAAPTSLATLNIAARTLHASASRSAESSHGHAAADAAEEEQYPEEGFSAPFWRNGLLLVIGGVIVYRFSAAANRSPHGATGEEETSSDSNAPLITRYLSHYKPSLESSRRTSLEELDKKTRNAEDRLLFQEAERPPVHRLTYPGVFDHSSPHRIPLGGSVNVSNVKVKTEYE